MYGPLGSGTVLINRNGGVTTFKDGSKKASDSSADRLFYKQTGVTLPVNNLYYWVRGVPAPGAVEKLTKNANQQISVLKQAGYTIEYLGYTNAQGASLPTKIRLSSNQVKIKVVIKQWKI